jgi:hypothetical protein
MTKSRLPPFNRAFEKSIQLMSRHIHSLLIICAILHTLLLKVNNTYYAL